MQFYSQSIDNVLKEVNSNIYGLKSQDVSNRYRGKINKLATAKKQSLCSKFFSQFKDLMVITLIISAAISITMAIVSRQYESLFEGSIIIFIVILNATLGVVQENKAESALESLKKRTESFCTVIRDNTEQMISVVDLVIGDIVVLNTGNIVPADIRLIETHNTKIDESSLTGESISTEKNADIVLDEKTPLGERKNMAYSSTSVTYGHAKGVVVAIGTDTEMGKISVLISSGKKELTPLQTSLNKIGKIISLVVLIIAIVIFIVEMTIPKNPNLIEAFLTAVALAVAAIPESLPASITIIMALGVQKLANKNVIIKRLHAVETLGSCNVICSDKTGTLTLNKMTVKSIFYNNNMVLKATADDDINKHFKEIINCIVLCNNSKIINGQVIGEPTETALIQYALDQGFNIEKIRNKYIRINELSFDSTRKLMSTINTTSTEKICYTKGAIDMLIPKCSQILINGKLMPMTTKYIKEIEIANCKMGEKALRIIGLAYKTINNYNKDLNYENNLVFLGLIGMIDPPRPEAKESIQKCYTAGLKPIMITGDHYETAFAIAKEIGIAKDKKQVLTGIELNELSDEELSLKINKYSVFARVTPEHKMKIIKAIKNQNKIVAMTGDGVNDAPSLKIADIGIGMGITGTDVTKEVSDMIISDDNFSTIIVAIKEGRKIYSNIQRTIQFLLSTNAVEVFTLFLTSLFLPQYTFLLPSQLLFINFITDSLPAISLGLEPEEKDIMQRPPRDAKSNIITLSIWMKILYQAAFQIIIVMIIYCIGLTFYNSKIASTLAFFVINIMQLLHAINLKTRNSIFKTNILANKVFNISFWAAIGLIALVGFVSPLGKAFGLAQLNGIQWLLVLVFSFSIIPFVEIAKKIIKKFSIERIK